MQTIKSPLYVELFKIVVINPLLLVSRKTDGSSSMMTQTKTPKAQIAWQRPASECAVSSPQNNIVIMGHNKIVTDKADASMSGFLLDTNATMIILIMYHKQR